MCLGIYDNNKIYGYHLETGRKLSSLLALSIARALEAAGLGFKDIDYFACGLGPGSFTGMRTGVAAIKGLSWVLKKPIIGISTLDILAQGVKESDNPVIPIVDAKRNLIYCAIFRKKRGRLKRMSPYMLLSLEEFLRKARPKSIFLGDAINLYKEKILERLKGATFLDKDYWYPKAHNLITLAQEGIKEKKFKNTFEIKPIYLYPKECQVKKA